MTHAFVDLRTGGPYDGDLLIGGPYDGDLLTGGPI